mmetsp:Transcript_24950/g.53897  ORF Transcript_24950/g.53897 Transcript_24950/m.53897 type:complete len:217 (+) Transcript_24950:782-1432(+)
MRAPGHHHRTSLVRAAHPAATDGLPAPTPLLGDAWLHLGGHPLLLLHQRRLLRTRRSLGFYGSSIWQGRFRRRPGEDPPSYRQAHRLSAGRTLRKAHTQLRHLPRDAEHELGGREDHTNGNVLFDGCACLGAHAGLRIHNKHSVPFLTVPARRGALKTKVAWFSDDNPTFEYGKEDRTNGNVLFDGCACLDAHARLRIQKNAFPFLTVPTRRGALQ